MEDKITKNNEQKALPNSTAVLVLGILSIVCCFCYGIVGVILGIIALVLSKKAIELYEKTPNNYRPESYANLKAGRVCGIIGLIISSLYFLFIILYLILVSAAIVSEADIPWEQF
jgi:uncharacterized protein YacL